MRRFATSSTVWKCHLTDAVQQLAKINDPVADHMIHSPSFWT